MNQFISDMTQFISDMNQFICGMNPSTAGMTRLISKAAWATCAAAAVHHPSG